MLEIYKRDEFNGKLKIITTFDSFDDMFRPVGYRTDFATIFGYDDVTRHNEHTALGDHQPPSKWEISPRKSYCYVAYEDGKFVTPDRLVGLYRKYKDNRRARWHTHRHYNRGQKKGAYGWIRNIKTFQERKWTNAWDDEEFAPRPRATRQGHNLPDAWDDYWAGAQKSWKWQSKRKHQWKEKN